LSNIFERIVHKRLTIFLENNSIISPSQFGFRANHSAIHPMIHLTNFVSNALNNKENALVIFCDLRKAFDMVIHQILFNKLYKIGIGGTELTWFKSYLTTRKQFVMGNGNVNVRNLAWCPSRIFFCYILMTMPLASCLKNLLFDDDAALLASGKDINLLTKKINEEFQKIVHYIKKNKIHIVLEL
jgi:Reverse transcriptase (RNA-dependent DNA polymerase)